MIIRAVHAVNVLKYARLDLENLPETGKIAVSGANESGKTAIVETISFALFGQTFSNGPDNLTRNIRWGESSCSVYMHFTATGNNRYTISRTVNKQGMHSAELFITGEDTPFASGPQAVQDEVVRVCGFDFEQYLDSLYLAQMEITSSASQAETIKVIAGSAALEAVSDDLKREISAEQDSMSAIEEEQSRIRIQIASLDIQHDRIAVIETENRLITEQVDAHRQDVSALQDTSTQIREAGTQVQEAGHVLTAAGRDISMQQWRQHLSVVLDAIEKMRESASTLEMESDLRSGGDLKKYTDKLQTRLSSFESVQEQAKNCRSVFATLLNERGSNPAEGVEPLPKQRSRLKRRLFSQHLYRKSMQLGLVILVLATVAFCTGWLMLSQLPDNGISATLSNTLSQQVPWWGPEYQLSLRNAAMVSLLLSLPVLYLSARLKSRINQGGEELVKIKARLKSVRLQAELLDHINDRPLPEVIRGLREIDNKPLKKALEDFVEGNGSIFVSEQVFADHQRELNALLDENASNVAQLREMIASRVGKLGSQTDEQLDRIEKLERESRDIQARQKEAADLETIIANRQPALDQHRHRIEVRETSLKLTAGACSNIYTQFNQVLSKYTAIVMPKLTEGRYSQIQIDDSLRVRVFSTEKNDFADLDELSSGTQRQIILALRLAISRALVEAGQQGRQFIILDEPFAFFDRERIRNTIKSLPDLDKNITQFWILTQEFESSEQFEMNINCSRDRDELALAG